MTGDSGPAPASVARRGSVLFVKNTLFLVGAQALITPLSVLVNAMMGRKLGPTEFGELYLASTFVSFGFLLVDWGTSASLTAATATDRERTGELLGSLVAFRAAASAALVVVAYGAALALHESPIFPAVVVLFTVTSGLGVLGSAFHDAIRGYHERTDFSAGMYVAGQLLNAAVVVPILLLGGHLRAVLLGQAACSLLGLAVVVGALRPMKMPRLSFGRESLRKVLAAGTPFMFLGLVMIVQPNVDAFFLSRFASTEAIGWHAAARKLVGILLFPASALITALYPTLCRLHLEDAAQYRKTAQTALSTTALLAAPLAVGTALYPDLGIQIFSRDTFRPAEDNLRILALFVFLVYFTMPLGTSLAAAGRQRVWSFVQLGCVVVSAVLDPLLIPYFQATRGNGGLGVSVASVASEVFVMGAGFVLAPPGVFDRALARPLGAAVVAGAAMLGAGAALRSLPSLVAAPIAVVVYALTVFLTRGVTVAELREARALLRR